VHTSSSSTGLHPDSNLACESAARAILSLWARTTTFVIYKGKGAWPCDGRRCTSPSTWPIGKLMDIVSIPSG